MEELKNLRNREEFKDSLNEELLWDDIKNLFSKVFGGMDKKLADSVSNFTKRLDGSKTWEESLKLYEEFAKKDQADTATSLQTVTGPLGLRKILYDNSCRIFMELQELSNKYQTPSLTGKQVFLGKPEAAMFAFDNSETFAKNAITACNAKMVELNTSSAAGYDEAALKTYLTSGKNKLPITVQTPPVDPAPAPAPVTAPAPGAITPPTPGDIQKLKDAAAMWLNTNLYGYTLEKVKATKPTIGTASVGGKDPYSSIAAGSKATANKESLAKQQ